MVKIGAIVEQN